MRPASPDPERREQRTRLAQTEKGEEAGAGCRLCPDLSYLEPHLRRPRSSGLPVGFFLPSSVFPLPPYLFNWGLELRACTELRL